MVNTRPGYATNGLTSFRDSANYLGQGFTNNAPPVCSHPDLESWMSQNGRSPFHSMNLSHQGRIGQASLLKDFISVLLVRFQFF